METICLSHASPLAVSCDMAFFPPPFSLERADWAAPNVHCNRRSLSFTVGQYTSPVTISGIEWCVVFVEI